MKVKMVALLGILGLFPACIFMDGANMPPPLGSIPKEEVAKGIRGRAGTGWTMAWDEFLQRKGVFGGVQSRDEYWAAVWTLGTNALKQQSWTGNYYRRTTVDACYEHVFFHAYIYTRAFLDNSENIQLGIPEAVLHSTYTGASGTTCDAVLKRTGYIVEFGSGGL
ncbi:MAG: hypothetical protein HS115_08425 [Spirochaetales bacterium]|nr:hypothetical protein [Spirochaetales bacterium]